MVWRLFYLGTLDGRRCGSLRAEAYAGVLRRAAGSAAPAMPSRSVTLAPHVTIIMTIIMRLTVALKDVGHA